MSATRMRLPSWSLPRTSREAFLRSVDGSIVPTYTEVKNKSALIVPLGAILDYDAVGVGGVGYSWCNRVPALRRYFIPVLAMHAVCACIS